MRPEDQMPDARGAMAAFLASVAVLEREPEGSPAYEEALRELGGLIPVLERLGIFDVFSVKSARLRGILHEARPQLDL